MTSVPYFDPEKIHTFPKLPGVYLMKDALGKILYIGKAKKLRLRIRQYFSKSGDERAIIPYLISQIAFIEVIVVPSEKEALLLENTLIKKHKPKYNVQLKDDKTYIALRIDTDHPFPKLQIIRSFGKPKQKGRYFGPYPSGHAAKETFDLLQTLFPLRQCQDSEFKIRTRPCILYDMKKCLAPCVGKCDQETYQQQVKETIRFLEGNSRPVLKMLQNKMEVLSDHLEFEKAQEVLKTIRFIEKTLKIQHVDQPTGLSADVIGLYRRGDEAALSLLFFRNGTLLGCRHHSFSKIVEEDEELLSSFILQNYDTQKQLPPLLLLPCEMEEKEDIEELLFQQSQKKIRLLYPQKGEKLALLKIANLNAKAAFNKEKDETDQTEKTLIEMQETLKLKKYPRRIECFDNSHLSGQEPVAALVVFIDGKKAQKEYRSYKLNPLTPGDDYGAMKEVLFRRLKRAKEEETLPDLLIIDGGKGHLNIALKILEELNIISIDVLGFAKEEGRHDKGLSLEKIFLPQQKDPLILKRHSPILFLLQTIRDESHRSALNFQKKRRNKQSFSSPLDHLPGIGKITKVKLLKHFGSLKRILLASDEELKAFPRLTDKQIHQLRKLKE